MIITILIERSLAELEWVLPVCREMKERDENLKIYILFLALHKMNISKTNTFIMSLVDEIVDGCYDMYDCMWPPVAWAIDKAYMFRKCLYKKKKSCLVYDESQMITGANNVVSGVRSNSLLPLTRTIDSLKSLVVGILLRAQSRSVSWLLERFVLCNKTMLLLKQSRHKPVMTVDRAVRFLRAKGIRTVGYPQSSRLHLSFVPLDEDMIIFNTELEKAQAVGCDTIRGNLVVVGVPRYDEGWISYLNSKFDQERKKMLGGHNSRVFLVNLQKEYSWIFSWKKFETYLDDILDVLSSEDAVIVFKPHPSQDLKYLEHKIASRNMDERLCISHSSSLALAAMADLIITMPSTSIYDLIPSGKPVIEYYDYSMFKEYKEQCAVKKELSDFEKKISGWPIYSEIFGRPASLYQKLGLVEGASNPQDLEKLVMNFVEGRGTVGFRCFRKYFPPDAASRAASEVLRFMASSEVG